MKLSAEKLENTLDSIANGIVVLDPQGNILFVNRALKNMIPIDNLQEIVSKPIEKTFLWKKKLFSVTETETPDLGKVVVFNDETHRSEIERDKDAILSTFSHEVRTPLTAVKNYIELLLKLLDTQKIEPVKFDEYLNRALENVNQIEYLAKNILDHTKMQAGAIVFKNEPFSLRALLEKPQRLLAVLLKEKNLDYNLTVDEDVPQTISGDPERLYQVLINLIGNAIKYTEQGGLTVRAGLKDKNPSTGSGQALVIAISDTGRGIPAEQLPNIFDAFGRSGDFSQSTHQDSIGLGLSISKRIIDRMGGSIHAASEVGAGSTFTITLPINGN